jgi:alpha-L-rhamnosidase
MVTGNGWYKGRLGYEGAREVYGNRFRVLAALRIRLADGTEQVIATDESWQYRGSDFAATDIYDGETLDRTLWRGKENPDRPAVLKPDCPLADRYSLPVTVAESLPVQEVIRTPAGETVLDFGQEITGFVTFSLTAQAGDVVSISHAEVLDSRGNFYTDNYRSAKARIDYICKDGYQTYRPHHTFFGFRYIRLDSFPGPVQPEDFTAVVLHSEMQRTGFIRTSDPLLNRLFENVIWGQKSNFLDVPTDCPQRNERMGWTGDAQAFIRTACYNYDVNKFFEKWLGELAFAQYANGAVPMVAPYERSGGQISAAWADAVAICPWQLYLSYGNKDILEKMFRPIQK